jgi:hypothetical protein
MLRRLAMLFSLYVPCMLLGQSANAGPSGSADPAYATNRSDEHWPATPSAGALRALKHIALRSDDVAWLTLGGSIRARGISYRNFSVSNTPLMQDTYEEMRTLASTDLWIGSAVGSHARIFAEGRDAQGFGRTLPGGIRVNEADRADWQNLFVEAGTSVGGLRYGRQELSLGRERLVGTGDWSNSRRSFEGTTAMASLGNLRFEAFDGRVVAVRISEPDRPDSTTQFRVASVATVKDRAASRSLTPAAWQVWVFRLQSDRGLSARTTVGARTLWKAPVHGAVGTFELEAASQRGHLKAKTVDAWYAVAEGTLTWKRVRWAPSALMGFDIASGTGADTLRRFDTFQPPYAAAHAFNGIADLLGRGNLAEVRVGGGVDPSKTVQLQGLLRHYGRVLLSDGVYTKANALFRSAEGSRDRSVMDELDFTANWQVHRQLKVQGGAAFVLPGSFLRNASGGATNERFAFLSTTYLF